MVYTKKECLEHEHKWVHELKGLDRMGPDRDRLERASEEYWNRMKEMDANWTPPGRESQEEFINGCKIPQRYYVCPHCTAFRLPSEVENETVYSW